MKQLVGFVAWVFLSTCTCAAQSGKISDSIFDNGNVGIHTPSPGAQLDVSALSPQIRLSQKTGGVSSLRFFDSEVGATRWDIKNDGADGNKLKFWGYGNVQPLTLDTLGNVGIGTTSPGAKLEVDGNLKVSGAGSSITFADGTVQSTAWTGVLCGGDYAESVDVSGSKVAYEPGDVIVIDKKIPGRFLKSSIPYSRLVAGIYSTKPGVVGRRSSETEKAKDEIPMAMVGIVPTKVSAENGPIDR